MQIYVFLQELFINNKEKKDSGVSTNRFVSKQMLIYLQYLHPPHLPPLTTYDFYEKPTFPIVQLLTLLLQWQYLTHYCQCTPL